MVVRANWLANRFGEERAISAYFVRVLAPAGGTDIGPALFPLAKPYSSLACCLLAKLGTYFAAHHFVDLFFSKLYAGSFTR